MKNLILLLILFFSFRSYSLNISPIPVNNVIDGSGSNYTDIYLSNTANISEVMNLSISNQQGFSILINRCQGKILKKNQSCYIRIGTDQSSMSVGTFQISLLNNSVSLVNLSFTKSPPSQAESSEFLTTSDSISDFGVRTIKIKNKTLSSKNYLPIFSGVHSSKFSILLNRCNNVIPNTVCSINYQLKPQLEGSYSVTLTEPQISNTVSINSNIASNTVGVLSPPIASMSVSSTNLNFGVLSRYGQSPPLSVIIQNLGETTLYPTLEFSNKTQLALNRCSSIQAGSSCSLSISLNPTFDMANGPILNQYVIIKSNPLDVGTTINVSGSLLYISSCPANSHLESGSCVSNSRSCTIPNGNGTQEWSSGNWGTCQNLVCDSNYSLDMSGFACTLSNTESSYAGPSSGSGRHLVNGLIIHGVLGSELTKPSYNNGLIIWTGDYK